MDYKEAYYEHWREYVDVLTILQVCGLFALSDSPESLIVDDGTSTIGLLLLWYVGENF